MGLDITVYEFSVPTSHQSLCKQGIPVEWCEDPNHVRAWAYAGFEQSLSGLDAGRCYSIDVVGQNSMGFRAGSYGGYNNWRNQLCRVVNGIPVSTLWTNADNHHDTPFFELINFADNEGCIGPLAAGQLYRDFVDNRHKVTNEDSDFIQLYDTWTDACELAAGSGVIIFH